MLSIMLQTGDNDLTKMTMYAPMREPSPYIPSLLESGSMTILQVGSVRCQINDAAH